MVMLIIVNNCAHLLSAYYVSGTCYLHAFPHAVLTTTLLGKYDFRVTERNGTHAQCFCLIHVLINLLHQHLICSSVPGIVLCPENEKMARTQTIPLGTLE